MDGLLHLLNQAGIALMQAEGQIQLLQQRINQLEQQQPTAPVLEEAGYKVYPTPDPNTFAVSYGGQWLSGVYGGTPHEALERGRAEVSKG